MSTHFPYVVAAVVTTGVGAVTSAVWGAPVAPPPHPVVAFHVVSAAATPARPVVPVANSTTPTPANNNNTPAQTPVVLGQAFLTAGFGVGQQVGTGGVPGVPSFTEGFATTSQPDSTSMMQPGQRTFLEGFSGNQGTGPQMTQPGVSDFNDGFGFNHGVVPPNQGALPTTPYPNYTTPPTPTNPGLANGTVLGAPSFGFYNGFGGGQPDVGFYAGFNQGR
jgi:hypothetical protein